MEVILSEMLLMLKSIRQGSSTHLCATADVTETSKEASSSFIIPWVCRLKFRNFCLRCHSDGVCDSICCG